MKSRDLVNGSEISRVTRSREDARSGYDGLSKWYDRIAGKSERPFTDEGVDRLNVRPGERVLEIGFGTGHALVSLARRVGSSGRVFGIDLSFGMLRVARSRIQRSGLSERIVLRRGDAVRLPFPAGFFDAVFMGFVLELFDTPDLPKVMGECRRVLRRRGRIAVAAMAKKRKWTVEWYERAHSAMPGLLDCRPIRVRETVELGGFRIRDDVERSLWGLPVEIIVAEKKEK
jgi:ubiquinone/menaquinone biosynthesis C-methylase UbiE